MFAQEFLKTCNLFAKRQKNLADAFLWTNKTSQGVIRVHVEPGAAYLCEL